MGTPIRVLIVEDSEEDTLLMVRELKRGGFDPIHERVETSESMEAALSTKTWDLILADYSMPHFSGLEALKLLKASGLDLPFIIVSGSIGEDVAVEAMKAGAHDYIMKNNLKRLIPAIEQELREAEVRRKLRESEKALKESEKRYRQVVESAAEIIYSVDEKGNFTYGNPAGLKATGYSLEELRKLNYADLIVPEHRERVAADLHNQFRQKIPTTHVEFPFFNKTGEIIWFSQNTSLLIEDGKVVGFHIIARDITERKHAEEALAKSEERYRSLFNLVPIGIYRTNVEGEILEVNPALIEMLGYPDRETLLRRRVMDTYIDPEGRTEWERLFEGKGIVLNFQKQLRRFDESIIWVLENTRVVRDQEGQVLYYQGSFQDITDRMRAEEALIESEQRYRNLVENAPDVIFTLAARRNDRVSQPRL